MSVTSRLKGPNNHPIDSVTNGTIEGLACATFPAKEYSHFEADFTNDLFANEMNLNGLSTGGLSLSIADGTGALDSGTPDWTIAGDPMSETTAAAHSGTNGYDTGIKSGVKSFFDNGAPLDITGFSSLNFWIKTISKGADSEIRLRWEDSTFSNLGSKLNLSSYITWSIGTWTYVSIPIADFGVTSPVQRLEISFKKSPQQHYIDEISLNTASGLAYGPQIFSTVPPRDQEYSINKMRITIVADQAGWGHNSFTSLPALASGLLLRVKSNNSADNNVITSVNLQDNMDLFGHFSSEDIITFFATGRLITFFASFDNPIILKDNLALELVVRDDLSSLLRLQARCFGGRRLIADGSSSNSKLGGENG